MNGVATFAAEPGTNGDAAGTCVIVQCGSLLPAARTFPSEPTPVLKITMSSARASADAPHVTASAYITATLFLMTASPGGSRVGCARRGFACFRRERMPRAGSGKAGGAILEAVVRPEPGFSTRQTLGRAQAGSFSTRVFSGLVPALEPDLLVLAPREPRLHRDPGVRAVETVRCDDEVLALLLLEPGAGDPQTHGVEGAVLVRDQHDAREPVD